MKAYVLIKTEANLDMGVLKKLENMPMVTEVHRLFGIYDIIAEIGDYDITKIRQAVDNIRDLPGVRETITCLSADMELDSKTTPL
ncbi:MAG: Lrp/AsnC ligand binding domain-containing protein [Candidatus Ranarchaeia archaeon]